ncbi:hypothetical protein J6590_106393 [Homalodisca vitripennis]|nr:hypothetical protein J6590_106393 [Homalodisca vitripennis]
MPILRVLTTAVPHDVTAPSDHVTLLRHVWARCAVRGAAMLYLYPQLIIIRVAVIVVSTRSICPSRS